MEPRSSGEALPVHSTEFCPNPCSTHAKPTFAALNAKRSLAAAVRQRSTLPKTNYDGTPRWPNGTGGLPQRPEGKSDGLRAHYYSPAIRSSWHGVPS